MEGQLNSAEIAKLSRTPAPRWGAIQVPRKWEESVNIAWWILKQRRS